MFLLSDWSINWCHSQYSWNPLNMSLNCSKSTSDKVYEHSSLQSICSQTEWTPEYWKYKAKGNSSLNEGNSLSYQLSLLKGNGNHVCVSRTVSQTCWVSLVCYYHSMEDTKRSLVSIFQKRFSWRTVLS